MRVTGPIVPAVSTPPFLQPPPGTGRREISTERGSFAALAGAPDDARLGTALLVPGFTGSKEDFICVLAPLRERGHRPVAVDLPGQFETPGPAGAEAYSLDGWADDVVAAAATLPGPVHLVGHSFGGLVARNAVLRAPSAFASVTFLCTGAGALPDTQHDRLRLFASVLESAGSAALWAAMQAMEEELGGSTPVPPDISAFLGRRFTSHSPGSLITMVDVLVNEPSRDDEVRPLPLPRQVVTGERDDAWGPEEQEARASSLGIPFSVVPDAGHSPAIDQPDVTVDVLTRFWTGAG
jgi:pimeloyl-ACP methyl ester carboxylesterase